MPTKTTPDTAKRYQVSGKAFTWTAEDGGTITIPLRIKLGLVRKLAAEQGDDDDMDTTLMFSMLDAIIPGQADALDDMDVNDFVAMFRTWQREYSALSGASLGE